MLGMLDTRLRSQIAQLNRSLPLGEKVSRRASNVVKYLQRLSLMKKVAYLPEKVWTHSLRGIYKLALSLRVRSIPAFLKNPGQIAKVAAMRYRPRPWPGTISIFRAAVQPEAGMPSDLGWSSLATGGVDVWEVPGDHWDVLHEPNIQILAGHLQQRLEKSECEPAESQPSGCSVSVG
jgi:thioesterase domain-containing protein